MQGRSRLLIIIAFIVIVVGVGAAFLLGRPNPNTNTTVPTSSGGTSVVQGSTSTPQAPVATEEPKECIVVAVQNLSRGLEIPANGIELRYWPESSAPREAFKGNRVDGDRNNCTIPEGVVGKIARTDIQREQPILTSMVVENLTELAKVGSDAAAILPAGYVAVAVPMDRLTSVAYAIQPGDRVDIIVSMLFVDVDLEFQSLLPNAITLATINEDGTIELTTGIEGRLDTTGLGNAVLGPSEPQRPRLATQRTIQDALVIWTGDFPSNGRLFFGRATPTIAATAEASPNAQQAARGTPVPPTTAAPRPDIVTLGVTPQDAVVLTWLIEARLPITFALRSAKDTSKVPTDQVTLDYIMSQYRITLPAKLNYSIQPAIRSIRQLIGGTEIELDSQ